MKKYSILILCFVCLFLNPHETVAKETVVSSKIKEVTVFLKGAQIIREARVTLPAGASQVVFTPLPAGLDPRTIQLHGKGEFTILAVKHKTNYLKNPETNPEYQALTEKFKVLQLQKEKLLATLKILDDEETMLKANQSNLGEQSILQATEWKNALNFYVERLTDIADQRIESKQKQESLSKEMAKINNQLQNYQTIMNKPVTEVIVDISSGKEQQAILTLEYYISQASWRPDYDIRVSDITQPAHLIYRAIVKQNTGENWEKVNLKLSTGNPLMGGTKPTLYPWYLDFYVPRQSRLVNSLQGQVKGVNVSAESKPMAKRSEVSGAETLADAAMPAVEQYERQTTMEFMIKAPYSIPSDNLEQDVTMADYDLPAHYKYFVVPKLDRDVFLVARLTDWEKYNLLSGQMHMFFEGTYVGNAFLNTDRVNDTLEISLGRDNNITVERKKIIDFTKKQLLAGDIREEHGWEITLHNKKKSDISIRIEEQIPVSRRKEIEVNVMELSGAILDAVTGKCYWDIALNSGKTTTKKITFSVKYPKDKRVIIN